MPLPPPSKKIVAGYRSGL